MTTTPTRTAQPLLFDEAAEQAVLGAMLVNPSAVAAVAAILDPEDYYYDRHRAIHRAVLELTAKDKGVDEVTVGALCEREYVHTLVEAVPTAANVTTYAATVKDLSLMREVRRVGLEIAELPTKSHDVRTLIDEAERRVMAICPPAEAQSVSSMSAIAGRIAHDVGEGTPAKSWLTGFQAVDDLLGGLHPQSFVVIGARPGIGKTAWALNIASAVAQQATVLFFSLEMSDQELGERFICAVGQVRLRDLRSGKLPDDKLPDVYRAVEASEKMRFEVIYDARTTLASLKAIARRFRAKGELGLIVIDYLQLMRSGAKEDSRWQEVSSISRELKILARELEVPVLALSQLNRETDSHWEGGKPKLSHLRESGAIEQDADAVLLLSWPKDRQGVVTVNVAKNRHGPLGEVELQWKPQYMRFYG